MLDLTTVAKVLLYAGATVAIGEVVLPASTWPAASPTGSSTSTSGSAPSRRVLRVGAAIALLLAPLIWLQAQLSALDIPWPEAGTLLGSGWGRNWGPLAIACAMAAVALPRLFGRLSTPLLWVGALAVGLAMGGLGHANADEQWPVGARVLDALHVLTMGAWIGALVLALADDRTGPASAAAAPARWHRVSRIATIAAPLAAITGVLSSLRVLGAATPVAVVASPYGRLLLVKAVIVLTILALGATQRRRVHAGDTPTGNTVRLEVALAVVVILLTAILTGSEPPE